jgi:dUTPase
MTMAERLIDAEALLEELEETERGENGFGSTGR